MHHDFKGTAGERVEYLVFIDNNKFPVLFKRVLNQKVVSNRCYSNNTFLSYSKKLLGRISLLSRDLLLIVLSVKNLTITPLEVRC